MRMKRVLIILPLLAVAACATPVPVDRPCGVIIDSLRDVQGKNGAERRRVDIHFERGVAAGCWRRS